MFSTNKRELNLIFETPKGNCVRPLLRIGFKPRPTIRIYEF